MATKKKTGTKTPVKTKSVGIPEAAFTVEQLCESDRFAASRYALAACLDKNKKYTVRQAQAALDAFLTRKV
ncbi:MAG: hypothetical protein IJK23_10200 [Clostridia bacterium]|nr:hypothetical protein [Clostridia bacterium]